MKIIFAGTPDFAVPTLKALITSRHEVISVYTQPDRPAGRGRKLQPSPVKVVAGEQGVPVYQPANFRQEDDIEELRKQQPDIMVVVAYGLILPQAVLDIPRHGCLNVHASLLPRWRGAAPIQRAILAGDDRTGITIMQMDKGLDTGDMLKSVDMAINRNDTGQTLHDQLAEAGAGALLDVVDSIANGQPPVPVQQNDEQATYAEKLNKAEAEIDWQQSAIQLDRLIRAFNPWPVAYTTINGESLRVWSARPGVDEAGGDPGTVVSLVNKEIHVATGKGQIVLCEVQPAGKRRMSAADYINARREVLQAGSRLGT